MTDDLNDWATPDQQRVLSDLLRKVWDTAGAQQYGGNLSDALASVRNLSAEQADAKIEELRARLEEDRPVTTPEMTQ